MKTLQWTMEELFYFPEEIGVPEEGGAVKVNAGFSENRTEDSVRLTGIYHVAAQVGFTEGERATEFADEAVYVDDVELEGNSGYFEYAVPLYIDLPPEVNAPLTLEATDVSVRTDDNGALAVKWNVTCTYADKPEAVAVEEPELEVAQEPKKLVQMDAEVAVHDSSSWSGHDEVLPYIATLPDEWTTTTFRSNDVLIQEESEAN